VRCRIGLPIVGGSRMPEWRLIDHFHILFARWCEAMLCAVRKCFAKKVPLFKCSAKNELHARDAFEADRARVAGADVGGCRRTTRERA